MNAAQIKRLGAIWGGQHGLLSVSELELLMGIVVGSKSYRVLEIGHYYGLSTCGLVHALQSQSEPNWRLVTVDPHLGTQHVSNPAPIEDFEKNRALYFPDERVTPLFVTSQEYAPGPIRAHDFVFYDGDHGEEQRRFTEVIIKSPEVLCYVFDDRDFAVPRECCDMLRAAGLKDASPGLRRLPGDKTNPETQTLAVFLR